MADVIATVWDFDKTLIHDYMQEPLFEDYGINSKEFWDENNRRIEALKDQGLYVDADTYYLNQMLRYVREGRLKGLNNDKLKSYGKKQRFYDGVVDLFKEIHEMGDSAEFKGQGIVFENYIVSSGLKKIIEGTVLAEKKYVKNIWGCEFAKSADPDGKSVISEITYSIDNTTKTRALFEINKGVNIPENGIDVNTTVPEEMRRVQFINMIYIADGPSDIPAFSVVNKNRGGTFAVYPKGDEKAFRQVSKMRDDGRVQMFAEADYTKNSTAYMWITGKLKSQGEKIINARRQSYQQLGKGTPQHLI